ncbi:MAG TPA: UbiA family prenyltransferase [Flavisolibacter sp.]
MLYRSTIQLLRFHFSLFLLPVYLFALSQAPQVSWGHALLVFVILHLLVYPASNGYNSYMDRDETPIGGLRNPMKPTKQLFYITLMMDAVALLLALVIGPFFAAGVLLYIAASRAYSYRGIRLKKYPVAGFLTVFLFQGALVFFITYQAVSSSGLQDVPLLPALISSLLIGALYPLTQVYQHEEDRRDGVTTISMMLGKRGTFIITMIMFLLATLMMYLLLSPADVGRFWLFILVMLPVVLFFLLWMYRVWRNPAQADYKKSLVMNVLSTFSTTIYFLILLIQKR